ncbi:hypothetical protein [Leucobacter salsicius]|uniref:hypothetical protein n=1 Tax=Leucobacter salsicius TaxID=664638 RepID=UPI00034D574C|nr:hypothetical protein [Leucobacter salsicius]
MNHEAGNALLNINARIERLGNSPATIAVAAGLPIAPTVRKLAGQGELTVAEVISICRVIELPVVDIFTKPVVREDLPCTVAACTYEAHEWVRGEQNGPCQNQRFEGANGVGADGDYIVWVQRWPGEQWKAYGEMQGGCEGEAGLRLIRDYQRDFNQSVLIADRLNGPELRRSTAPGAPPFEEVLA